MMADTASLVVRVKSTGVSQTSSALGGLSSAASKAATSVAGLVSVGAGLSKLVDVSRKTDVLNASLLTMTGSAENAKEAFAEIEKFARNTPYALDQSVTAFTKLVSLGLTPSQKALESYGNTASAMGKDLNQMIEAVADATTLEFERLKEFGIKSRQEGDKVSFTFQGMTTTVGKSAAEIEGYLMALGENQFAGAMANRMATLDGALSNLQDSWDGLFRAISSQGAGGVIEEQVRNATAALDELNASISSGEALAAVTAWGDQWDATSKDIQNAITLVKSELSSMGFTAVESSTLMSDAFWHFPANVRAAVQVATVEVAGFIDKTRVWAKALNPENWLLTIDEFGAKYAAEFATIDQNVASTNSEFLAQRDQRIGVLSAELAEAKRLRQEYEAQQKSSGTDLGKFKVQGSGGGTSEQTAQQQRDAAKLAQQQKSAETYIEQLRQANLTEMQLIDTQEMEKKSKLQEYKDLNLISEQQYQDALTEIQTTAVLSRAEIQNAILDEQSRIADETRKQQIADAAAAEAAMLSSSAAAAASLGDITSALQSAGKEQSAAYKVLFAAQKAAAIPSMITATEEGATKALSLGPIAGPIAAGAIKALGYASIGVVAGQAITGAREQGGYMTGGSAYQMAERGKAEVIVPAGNSRAKTISQMNDMMGGNSGSTSVVIVNQTTGRIDSAESDRDDEGRIRIIIREEVSSGLLNQDSQIAKARRSTRGQAGY